MVKLYHLFVSELAGFSNTYLSSAHYGRGLAVGMGSVVLSKDPALWSVQSSVEWGQGKGQRSGKYQQL